MPYSTFIMYPLQDLAALVAVAETGSVRGAASALGRTQPAVTQAIRRLEDAVGFSLLDRSGYRARLTDRGDLFVKRARSTVDRAQDLRTFARLLADGFEPRLRIACHGAISQQAWTSLLASLCNRFPDTMFELEFGEGEAPIRALLGDKAQLAILLHEVPDRLGTSVESVPMGEVDFVTAVRCDRMHLLATEGTSFPQILVADFDDPSSSYGVVEGLRYCRVSSHRAKAALIENGIGWGGVPEAFVEEKLASGELCVTAFMGMRERSRRPFSLFRKRGIVPGPVASAAWDEAHSRDVRSEELIAVM
jgi:DNA-binding transcriptional LysR family regulator